MFDAGLLSVLGAYVTGAGWRALRGAPPARPVRFAVVAAVTAVIHLGFHAAATAAPAIDAVALVLAGWTSFGFWCLWLSRAPSVGFRPGEEDGGSGGADGGGGGPGPGDDPRGGGDGPSGDDGGLDWDAFERDFAVYVARSHEAEPAAD
jgi:hypothetical protein